MGEETQETRQTKSQSEQKAAAIRAFKGPYQVLGGIALAAEVLLTIWFSRAQTGAERIVTGSIMLLLMMGIALVVLKLTTHRGSSTETPRTIIQPPTGEASEEEIKTATAQFLAGPDRDYLVNGPPPGWTARELSMADWLGNLYGISDKQAKDELGQASADEKSILVLGRDQPTSIIPIPGQTTIDGRKLPTALGMSVSTQLAIIPMDRAQAPYFIEHSLEQNFLVFMGRVLGLGLLTARNMDIGPAPHSGRRYVSCDCRQEIRNAIVNNKAGPDVTVNISVIAIEGELRDHLLIMRYVTVPDDAGSERDFQTMKQLVASFRPIKLANAEQRRKEMAKRADEDFAKVLSISGEDAFYQELRVLLLRFQSLNYDDPDDRLKAMKMIKPFEIFAHELKLESEGLDSLWTALHLAESGDATQFIAQLTALMESPSEAANPELEGTPPALASAELQAQAAVSGQATS